MTELEPRVDATQLTGALELVAALEKLGSASETSLILPPGMSYERYEAVGMALAVAYRKMIWMVADWIVYGEREYPKRMAQAVEVTLLHPETLKNYARIADRVAPDRRIPGVPITIHAEVASLEPEQQTLWLEKARDNKWRREDLRNALRPVKHLPELDNTHARVGDVEDAARDLVRSAKKYGNDFLVRRPSFVQLCAALGEEV